MLGMLPIDPTRPPMWPLQRLVAPAAEDPVWSLLEHLG
jgi:hypothetical protein